MEAKPIASYVGHLQARAELLADGSAVGAWLCSGCGVAFGLVGGPTG